MLEIHVNARSMWDEEREEFVEIKECTLRLEHSLLSLTKWESKWHKPFLSKAEKTNEETLDYIRCMSISSDTPFEVICGLSKENIETINDYIGNPMSATTFQTAEGAPPQKRNKDVMTSEMIYYYMTAYQIPFDPCEKWHLNRLLNLIRIASIKNSDQKKRKPGDIMRQNHALNAARRKHLGTRG